MLPVPRQWRRSRRSGLSVTSVGSLRRDVQVMGLIGTAHGLSHFFQTVLLVTLGLAEVRQTFGVDFIALGAVSTVFYVVSGVGQFAAGFVVDRFGARPVLLFGLTAAGIGIAGLGTAQEYWQLVAAAIVAGCGNAVFHPADYAILNASVSSARLGRSYGMHSLLGSLGWAAAPIALIWVLNPLIGWRQALLVLGSVGPVLAILLATQGGLFEDHRAGHAMGAMRSVSLSRRTGDVLRLLFQAPILLCFVYFMFLAVTIVGIQYAAVPTLNGVYGVSEGAAGFALTSMLVASAVGVGIGGFVADRVHRHDVIASVGMLLAGATMAVVASGALPAVALPAGMALVGFFGGITTPSRDMIVRGATPQGASGKVFGFVYSGLDAGSALSPLLFAFLLDSNMPSAVLFVIAALYIVSIVTVLNIRRLGRPVAVPAQ
jgi:FSR family fosmidomycin resistance protein-like MFS transporter